MKKITGLFVLLLLGLPPALSSAQENKEIVFYNWKDYTDQTILDDFEKQTGIKVVLREYETKDMMLSEFQSAPGDFDVILASDETIPSLIQSKLIEPLNLSKISNEKSIDKKFRNLPFDPQGQYSLAYLWGTAGLVINTQFVPADTDSWSILWDVKYKDKIVLMDDFREVMVAVLKHANASVNTTDPKDLSVAQGDAVKLGKNGVQFGDTLGNVKSVISGEQWIGQAYNGDVMSEAKNNNNIRFVLPKEGFSMTVDNFVISADSANKEAAYQLINFFLEPRNAARTAKMFSYATTVDAHSFLDRELLDNPAIYPPQNIQTKAEILMDVREAESEYARIFNTLKQIKP